MTTDQPSEPHTDFLATSVPDAPGRLEAAAEPGSLFGAWKVCRLLAQGGMGEVYEVERADGAYTATAALKLSSLLEEKAADQFRRERQALAQLEHPGITRVIDGGTAPGGRPFMVMELVEGTSLDQADLSSRSVRERLDLFLEICAAVIFAHRSLVLHRDLKPSNILLDKDGRVRLIDFGISVSMDQVDAQRGMTALFAAPEQWRREAASIASDVFSLGLVLAFILTGNNPQRDEKGAVLPWADGVVGKQLLAILRKATAFSANDRYASVDALARDVQACRDSRPVDAFEGGPFYPLSCFIKRNAFLSGTAAALALSLVVGLSVSLVLLQNVRESRSELAKALAETEFALLDSQFTSGQQTTTANLMQSAAYDLGVEEEQFIQRYVKAAKEAHASYQDDPIGASQIVFTVGRTLLYKNDFEGTIEIVRPWVDAGYGEPYWLTQGDGLLYVALRNVGRADEALFYARRYLAKYAEGPGANTASHAATAAIIAEMTYEPADAEAAIEVIDAAIATGDGPQIMQFLWDKRGRMSELLGDLDARAEAILRAMDIADENPLNKDSVQDSAYRLRAAEALFRGRGDAAAARAIAERVRGDLERVAPRSRDTVLANVLLAEILLTENEPAMALATLDEVAPLADELFGQELLYSAQFAWLRAEALAQDGQCAAADELLASPLYRFQRSEDAAPRLRIRAKTGERCVAVACGREVQPMELSEAEERSVRTSLLTTYYAEVHCTPAAGVRDNG